MVISNLENSLKNEKNINWFILHKLSKKPIIQPFISFGILNSQDEKGQGYFNLKSEDHEIPFNDFEKFIKNFLNQFNDNVVCLENLFVLITRISSKKEMLESRNIFKNSLDMETKKVIYRDLIDSLNKNPNVLIGSKKSHFLSINFEKLTFDEWIQYTINPITHMMDTLNYTVNLVSEDKIIDYEYIKPMSNLMRIILISYGGKEILFSSEDINNMLKNNEDAVFLASIIFNYHKNKRSNNFCLSDSIFDNFIHKFWEDIGIFLLAHVFGYNSPPKNKNLFEKLKRFTSKPIIKSLKTNNENSEKIVNAFFSKKEFFSDDILIDEKIYLIKEVKLSERLFISFVNLINECNINILDLDDNILKDLFEKFVDEFKNRVNNINNIQKFEKNLSYFLSSPYGMSRYNLKQKKELLKIILILVTFCDDKTFKKIENVCYELKMFLFTKNQVMTLEFCTFLITLLLSYDNNSSNELFNENKIEKLFKIIDKTILIPYVLLCEKEYSFWNVNEGIENVEYKPGLTNFFINYLLINSNSSFKCYADIKEKINSIKNTYWIYDYEHITIVKEDGSEEKECMEKFLNDFYDRHF